MKFIGLLFVVAFTCFAASFASEIKTEKGVYILTAKNYKQAVQNSSKVLVVLYAPWCGYCKQLLPELTIAAAKVKTMKTDAKVAKLDCTEEEKTCADLGVKGYPTIMIYENGTPTVYRGRRTADAIVAALVN